MDGILQNAGGPRPFPWRKLVWGTAIVLMLAATVAKFAVPSEFQWTGSDFVAAAVLLGVPCLAFEVALRVARGNTPYLLASCLGIGTAFLSTWINLAVGIIGEPGNPPNAAFFAVFGVALVGALLARLRAAGLSRAMVVAGVAQWLVAGYAYTLGSPEGIGLALVFGVAWFASAGLFRIAARQMASPA